MEKYYHLHSSPLLHCPLFRNDVGRRFFLNHLALVLIDSRVKIYVYCLMDNHIHFLVSGEENDIIELFAEVKKIYGRFLVEEESHIPISLDRFSISMRVISGGEDFKIVTAYILRNGLVAGLLAPPSPPMSSDRPSCAAVLAAFVTRRSILEGVGGHNQPKTVAHRCNFRGRRPKTAVL